MGHTLPDPQTRCPVMSTVETPSPPSDPAPPPPPVGVPAGAPAPLRPAAEDPPANLWGAFTRWAEKKFSLLSTKHNFGHRLCSWIFLPLAYRSGIKFRGRDGFVGDTGAPVKADTVGPGSRFECVLPFSRFNKNWYNAMAGAALLANSEVAGGMYIFKSCGGDYTVVCKHMDYRFRRPCVGPAVYRIEPREPIDPLVAEGGEFNYTLDIIILQAVVKKDEKERKVGSCVATFHVAPKAKFRARQAKLAQRKQRKDNL